ncbi:hypothetical protein NA56DRAFT_371717 [Hyaloscypha hepaticicola]|uniref:Uncharacterized protein n=1 Tax=Hyaloscypha hepaticicola TaxID=2082293 RepID=A0A2J6PKD8_9HELO|nr:hypothetical protein NA56DRAFT_371717 [Hyaloscypha hepaticicola]
MMGGWIHEVQIGYWGGSRFESAFFSFMWILRGTMYMTLYRMTSPHRGNIFTVSHSVACMRCCRLSCIAYQRLVVRRAEHFSSLLRFTTHDIVVSTRKMMNGIGEA